LRIEYENKANQNLIFNIISSSSLSYSYYLPEGEDPEAIELNEKKVKAKQDDEKEDDTNKLKKKEQSVLQAKLTKLAIQLGYAGK
jgi:hypothetical protein